MLAPDRKLEPSDDAAIVDEAILSRRSVRAFLPTPVDEETIRDILNVAARAPSGTNMQPWRTYVTTGATKQAIADAVLNSGIRAEKARWDEYKYYPDQFFEPYLTRRRKVGFDLYALLGIARDDMAARKEAVLRNFDLFGAPVALLFTIDRRLARGSWIDVGMFMQNVMIAARAFGLETCPQAAWCNVGKAVRRALPIPDGEIIVSGMALGYEDTGAPENTLVSEREPLSNFVRVHTA